VSIVRLHLHRVTEEIKGKTYTLHREVLYHTGSWIVMNKESLDPFSSSYNCSVTWTGAATCLDQCEESKWFFFFSFTWSDCVHQIFLLLCHSSGTSISTIVIYSSASWETWSFCHNECYKQWDNEPCITVSHLGKQYRSLPEIWQYLYFQRTHKQSMWSSYFCQL